MPPFAPKAVNGKKRKAIPQEEPLHPKKSKSSPSPPHESIPELEKAISESRKHYNNIVKLQELAFPKNTKAKPSTEAVIALCRVFCRLFASGSFELPKNSGKSEISIVEWLEGRKREYNSCLLAAFSQDGSYMSQAAVIPLAMRLVAAETSAVGESRWRSGLFSQLVRHLIIGGVHSEPARSIFTEEYFTAFDDVRYHTLQILQDILKNDASNNNELLSPVIELLLSLDEPPTEDEDLDSFLSASSKAAKSTLQSVKKQKKMVEQTWLSILGLPLNKKQRKDILRVFVHQIIPWFNRLERLMDFLTDCYDQGGETTLLALAGLFHLMQEKNLDYPSFFEKLYSLLDDGLLHSKHRSRFFRLLDTFMTSTHLPSNLVASFIKRLSRLALYAPPSGVVVVIPWIYNMFKRHPATTFMIHRVSRCAEETEEWETYGAEDPFSMDEQDPMETKAMESSLWELETLQSHYHPNVATLAKIISEQFTKESYNLEDFLDHSYNSLLDVELEKDLKKIPVVEYQIPKTILHGEAGDQNLGALLQQVIAVS
ncbi:CBF-domain-containing protein [Microthyrium microscopicum]|uniref:CBF-domain-containing protein n=1 Tax=Microthyrium microscopicum TaxID=703497 RepID=A0A6A6UUP1_9PEZI|nr:CBF-domain-containing protein [Microthyrium microscopicum]